MVCQPAGISEKILVKLGKFLMQGEFFILGGRVNSTPLYIEKY